jgi:hypothetical protein
MVACGLRRLVANTVKQFYKPNGGHEIDGETPSIARETRTLPGV